MSDDTTPDILEDCAGVLTVRPPWPQAIIWGPCRILNREERPSETIMGERIAVGVSKTVDEGARDACIAGLDGPWPEYGPEVSELRRPTDYIDWSEVEGITDRPAVAQSDEEERYEWLDQHHHPGHIIGTVRVVGYQADPRSVDSDQYIREISKAASWSKEWLEPKLKERGSTPNYGPVMTSITDTITADPWWQGPIGWLLDDPKPLDEPVPARGMPGVWDVAKQIKEAQSE